MNAEKINKLEDVLAGTIQAATDKIVALQPDAQWLASEYVARFMMIGLGQLLLGVVFCVVGFLCCKAVLRDVGEDSVNPLLFLGAIVGLGLGPVIFWPGLIKMIFPEASILSAIIGAK